MTTNINLPLLASARTGNTGNSAAAAAASASTAGEAEFQGLTITDFYKLLAVQMQYQDMDNPMDTSQMMTQMVQSQMSQAITQMSNAVSEMSMVNLISYASSMMGKEVTLAEVDDKGEYTGKETKGVVTGVRLGSTPTVVVNGKEYYLAQIMSVGQVPGSSGGESVEGETKPPATEEDGKVEGSGGVSSTEGGVSSTEGGVSGTEDGAGTTEPADGSEGNV